MSTELNSQPKKNPLELHREMYERRRRDSQLNVPFRPSSKPAQRDQRPQPSSRNR